MASSPTLEGGRRAEVVRAVAPKKGSGSFISPNGGEIKTLTPFSGVDWLPDGKCRNLRSELRSDGEQPNLGGRATSGGCAGCCAEKGVRLIYFAKRRRNKNPDPIFGGRLAT